MTLSGVLEGHHQESILSLICWSDVFEGCCSTKNLSEMLHYQSLEYFYLLFYSLYFILPLWVDEVIIFVRKHLKTQWMVAKCISWKKVKLSEKQWKAFKNCFRVVLWKLIWFGEKFCKELMRKFVKNNKMVEVRVLNLFELLINTRQMYLKAI